ncbi:hypothetical protein J2T20_004786 [Paenibacillus wynnii]|nr:hypothetical protein [Paenibacillus wynnii]
MNSYNHYAYGAIGEWLYRYVAGLDLDDTEAAYKRIRIPVNSTAQIVLPGVRLTELAEESGPAATSEGILSAEESLDGVTLVAGSGNYLFSIHTIEPE